jgi:hypothetical protein
MKRFKKISLVSFCALVFLCSLMYAQSQGTGAIVGKVTTPDGEILPGVEIRLSSPNLIGGDQATITQVLRSDSHLLILSAVIRLPSRMTADAIVSPLFLEEHIRLKPDCKDLPHKKGKTSGCLFK